MSTQDLPGSPGAGGRVPVCPRHPDRVSYVTCQRCGRPTCGECQRPAPVGIHCVDCVREASAARPAVRTALGGRVRSHGQAVTMALLGVNILTYVASMVLGQVYSELAFMPALAESEPHRFLTTAFLHGGFLHLAVNMYALYLVGAMLEPLLGRWRFAALYLVSAVGGSVAVLVLAGPGSPAWTQVTVGASGAVFGLFAASFFVLRRFGRDVTWVAAILAINLALGFVIPNVSWQAHVGGMLTGAVLAAGYVYAPRGSRTVWSVIATVLVVLVLVALALSRYGAG